MASGTIPCFVKPDTYSGTTDSNGNVRLYSGTRKVISIIPDAAGQIAVPWFYGSSKQAYAKILASSPFAAVTSTDVLLRRLRRRL